MKPVDKVVPLRRPTTFEHWLVNRLLGSLLVAVLAVGAFALWRSTTENTSQPHVPTWKKVAPR